MTDRFGIAERYWRDVLSWSAVDRESAFRRWRESGYRDTVAHDCFVAAFGRATNAGAELRKIEVRP